MEIFKRIYLRRFHISLNVFRSVSHYGVRSLAVSLELLIKDFVWVDCQKFIFQLFDI